MSERKNGGCWPTAAALRGARSDICGRRRTTAHIFCSSFHSQKAAICPSASGLMYVVASEVSWRVGLGGGAARAAVARAADTSAACWSTSACTGIENAMFARESWFPRVSRPFSRFAVRALLSRDEYALFRFSETSSGPEPPGLPKPGLLSILAQRGNRVPTASHTGAGWGALKLASVDLLRPRHGGGGSTLAELPLTRLSLLCTTWTRDPLEYRYRYRYG